MGRNILRSPVVNVGKRNYIPPSSTILYRVERNPQMVASKKTAVVAKPKNEKAKKVKAKVDPKFDKAGHVIWQDTDGNVILGISKKAFTENAQEKGQPGRVEFMRKAKLAVLEYFVEVAQARFEKAKTKTDPTIRLKARRDKLMAQLAELEAELGE